jgi:hypothetical protein
MSFRARRDVPAILKPRSFRKKFPNHCKDGVETKRMLYCWSPVVEPSSRYGWWKLVMVLLVESMPEAMMCTFGNEMGAKFDPEGVRQKFLQCCVEGLMGKRTRYCSSRMDAPLSSWGFRKLMLVETIF